MLIGMLCWWAIVDNGRRYSENDANIAFISDVGAAHQWLFIVGCVLTAVTYFTTLLFERWLRHVDRIPGTVRSRERILDVLAIVFGGIGATALILLSCFKSTRFSTVHWICTCIFVLGVAISCIFQTWEMFALKEDHPDRKHLRRNAIMKAVIVAIAIAVAIGFAACYAICHGEGQIRSQKCDRITSAAAVCEWAVSFILVFYFATFVLDLWPAAKTSPRHIRRQERKSGYAEKGLVAPEPTFIGQSQPESENTSIHRVPSEAERNSYYAEHPEYYQQNPTPVHHPAGLTQTALATPIEDPSGYPMSQVRH